MPLDLWVGCGRCALFAFGGFYASVSGNRRHSSKPWGGPIVWTAGGTGAAGTGATPFRLATVRTRQWQFPFLAVRASAIAFNGQQIRVSAFRSIGLVRDDSQ